MNAGARDANLTKYVSTLKVVSVIELKRQINWRKDTNGQTTFDEISLGIWSVRFDGCSALHFPFQPDWKVGDVIRWTLEKV